MEQLLKLPQVRISTLEKLISSQTFRSHNQKVLTLNGGAIIEGQKPYYVKNRENSKCQCVHMKCMCKFKLQEPELDKYPYLKRKKKNHYDPNRCYTQPDQLTQDLFSISQSKHFHQQLFSKSTAREPWEFKIWNKFSNAYSRISLENKEKILEKYGNNITQLDLKKYLFEQFKLLGQSNSLANGLILNDPNSLLSFMEQCFKNRKSLINKTIRNNQNTNYMKTKSGKSLKSEKNLKKGKRAKKQKGKQNEKVKFSNDKKDSGQSRMSLIQKDVVLNQIESQISELILKISNKQAFNGSEDFMSTILNSSIDEFSLKLSQMQKMMGQSEGNQQLKSMLYQNLQNFLQHIRLTQLISEEKCLMLKQFCKMLKKQVQETEAIRNLHSEFRQKSMKCVKTVKRIKSIKSIKSLKRLNFDCEQDEIDSQNEANIQNRSRIQNSEYHYSIESKSKIPSHFEMIEDDSALNSKKNMRRSGNQREGKMMRGSTKRTSFFKLNSKKSVTYESEVEGDEDNLNNSKSKSLKKSLKFALETKESDCKEASQPVFHIQKSRLDLSKKKIKKRVQLQHNKKEVLKIDEPLQSYLPSKQVSPSITRKVSKIQESIIEVNKEKQSEEGHQEMSDEEVVLKKRTNNARFMKRVRALKQKNIEISKKIIEDFVRENQETVQTAKTYLKRQQLEEFIIGKTDSLLIKKKKLRNLKNIMNKESKPSVMKQILKYINLYETECELIMYRGVNEKIEKKQEGEEFTCKKLIEGYRLLDELKLISLSKEYVYGECDDHEMEQISNKKVSKQTEVLNKKQPIKEEVNKKCKKKAHNIHFSQGDLIQVDVPEQGKYEKIPKQSFEKRKSIPEVIVEEKQNLYKKIKNFISQKKKTKKDSKFLLTQNLTFVDQNSRLSRTRHSLI